jgi:hypothetical protein
MPATKKAIDFTNVKEQGDFNPKNKPSGDYRMKVVKVEDATSKAGNDQWVFTIVPVSDQRATYPYYVQQDTDKAWKIRNLFIAAGFNVPKKRAMVDPNKLVGKEIGATLEDDEYEGRLKSIITQVFRTDELEEDAPEQTVTRASSNSKRKARKSADDEDFPDDEENVDEVDLEEL